MQINTIGPLVLFQATYPLLKASTSSPKFVLISSRAGSIAFGTKFPIDMLPYGASKAAANFLARKLHYENDGLSKHYISTLPSLYRAYINSHLVVFPICPGSVETDMGMVFFLFRERFLRTNHQASSSRRSFIEDGFTF
jgi:NAD(P)-dependent dehydrogenase (short-subunit alcohol dehydrogenase family)